MLICIQQDKLSVKSRMGISKLHQPVHFLNYRPFEFLFDFIHTIIMAVDISGLSGFTIKIPVVSSCKESHIINLRNSRSKKLYSSGDQITLILRSKCIIIGTADLVGVKF